MRLSQYLLATLREDPKEAEVVSHRLMLRAGMIRQLASGIYDLLPTGTRVLRRVERIVREEMNRAGALEVILPVVQPAELWKESGRWDKFGPELLRLKDRHGRYFVLGPTHEEVIVDLVRRDVSSYRQLPLNLYQIHTKFRDEVRPRFGLMRAREFVMKDAYSFHVDDESLDATYQVMYETYGRIFDRCGLDWRAVEADTGAIGGSVSHEFMVLAESGEDEILFCDTCTYAANVERAEFHRTAPPDTEATEAPPEQVATPGRKAIEDVAAFLQIGPNRLIKSLAFETPEGIVLACVRGDRDVEPARLRAALGVAWLELASPERVEETFGVEPGFLGPVGAPQGVDVVCDPDVLELHDAATGANQPDAHLIHVEPRRDLRPDFVAEIAAARKGDGCPRCNGTLDSARGIEVGHIFRLGTSYAEAMDLTVQDANGKAVVVTMGCYGIGIGRTAAAAIEQNHDEKGIIWPAPLAPFDVAVVPLDLRDDKLLSAATELYQALLAEGLDACLDDRNERPGVKLSDSELIGIPLRVVFGRRGFERGVVEVTERRTGDTLEIPVPEAREHILQQLQRIRSDR